MSLARIVVRRQREVDRGRALPNSRKAPPVPLPWSWQPEPAQVFVDNAPLMLIGSGVMKMSFTHFWKNVNESLRPVWVSAVLSTASGFVSGLPPPPQAASASAPQGASARRQRSGAAWRHRSWGAAALDPRADGVVGRCCRPASTAATCAVGTEPGAESPTAWTAGSSPTACRCPRSSTA